MSATTDMLKTILEAGIAGAKAEVYESGDDLLIEVVSPSLDDNNHVSNQDRVLQVLNTQANLGYRFFIQLFTYSDKSASFNSLARLCTIPSGWKGGIHTSTLAAGDAYIYLAEIDAARLKYGWRDHSFGNVIQCKAIQATDGAFSAFKIHEGTKYLELEIDGQHHRIRNNVKKLAGDIWEIEVMTSSGFGDGYAMG